ncbi:hypothetical protein Ciccas_012572, partial [Cichlidogyrus casuarinus]
MEDFQESLDSLRAEMQKKRFFRLSLKDMNQSDNFLRVNYQRNISSFGLNHALNITGLLPGRSYQWCIQETCSNFNLP